MLPLLVAKRNAAAYNYPEVGGLFADITSSSPNAAFWCVMIVGLLTIHIHLHGIDSLKQKRSIVKSLIGRLQSRFNFSVAEIEAHDSKQLAVIGLAVVGGETAFIHQQMDAVVTFAQRDGRFYLGQVQREVFSHN